MKILSFCDYPVYMSFYKALSDIGNNVIIFNLNSIQKKQQYLHISTLLDELKPDIVLTVGRPEVHGLSLESLKILYNEYGITVGQCKSDIVGLSLEQLYELCKRKNILHVYWATEDRTYHYKYCLKLAENFDFVFTPATECISNYNAIGKASSVLKYACLPSIHRRVNPDLSYISDISIAASYHSGLDCDYVKTVIKNQENDEDNLRKQSIDYLVLPLIENGYNVSIWGNGWDDVVPSKYIKGYISYENLNILYSSSKIVLGLEWDNISNTKTTGRPFEVLGCGAFFLTLRTNSISNIFIDRTHLSLSSSPYETLEIVDYYLNNEKAREDVSIEGQREVYSKHTYYHRAGEFINAIKPYLKKIS